MHSHALTCWNSDNGCFFGVVVVGLRQYDDVVSSYVNASWLLQCHVCNEVIINHHCRAKAKGTPTSETVAALCVAAKGSFYFEKSDYLEGVYGFRA